MKHGRLLLAALLFAASSALGQTIIFNPSLITGGTPANVAETVFVIVENTSNTTVNLTQIGGVKSTFAGTDWLDVSPTSMVIPPNSSDEILTVIMNKNGVFGGPGVSYRLEGYIFAKTNLPDPDDSLILPITEYDIGGGLTGLLKVDTLATDCLRLSVSESGEMGELGSGTVNLDYLGKGIDCSPTAKIYIYSGGPMLIRKNGPTDYTFHSGLYQTEQFETSQSFTVLNPGSADTFSTPDYAAFTTGVLATADTTLGIRRTYFAPKNSVHGTGPCDGIIVKTELFSLTGGPANNLTLAEVTDWDVPSDADAVNSGGIDTTIHAVYQRGIESDGTGCQSNAQRFAAQVFLSGHGSQFPCAVSRLFHGGYLERADSLLRYDTTDQSVEGMFHWNASTPAGLRLATTTEADPFSVLTYRHNFNLAAGDTLVVFAALTTIEKGSIFDLENNATELYTWYRQHLQPEFCPPCEACCTGTVGNVKCEPDDGVDVGDLTALIDNLFLTFTPLCCVEEANCDGGPAGQIDVGDLTALIDNLFLTFKPLRTCCGQ
jgi:hypothetical protein